jgi:hypothetical protein
MIKDRFGEENSKQKASRVLKLNQVFEAGHLKQVVYLQPERDIMQSTILELKKLKIKLVPCF